MKRVSRLVRSLRAFADGFSRPAALQVAASVRPRVGLALGGGFARGMAHIGVLKVFQEEGIPIDFVAGTSSGAIVAAMYCSGTSVREMEELARTVRFRHFARWTVSRLGFCSNDRMKTFLGKAVQGSRFEELKTPLAIAATNLYTGDEVIFRRGSLLDAIRASCAYPGMFQPVEVDGRLLIDGLLVHPVPSQPVRRMGADRVIGVHLSAHWSPATAPRHMFEVIGQCFSIVQQKMASAWKMHTDVVVEPNVDDFAYDAFERAPELIRAGEVAARAALPAIKRWLAVAPEPAKQKVPAGAAQQPATGS